MYEHITRRKPQKGDIVEFIKKDTDEEAFKYGCLYICKEQNASVVYVELDSAGSTTNGHRSDFFKIVKTSPSSNAKKGDTVICINNINNATRAGNVFENIPEDSGARCFFKPSHSWEATDFLLLHKRNPLLYYNENSASAAYEESMKRQAKRAKHARRLQIEYAEEQQMKQETQCNDNITVTMTAAEYKKHAKSCKPKEMATQLEAKLPFAMVVYNTHGSYEEIFYNKTRKGVLKRKQKFLQHPSNIGKTITVHKVFGEFTTNIPVVKVK